MSESLCAVLVLASLILAVRTYQSSNFHSALVLGIVFGFAILVRSNLSVWLAGFFVSFAVWKIGSLLARQSVPRPPLNLFVAFAIGVGLACSPWWARNCWLSGSFAPLGTGGQIGMVGGYCDGCLAEGGNWNAAAVVAVEQEVMGRGSQRGKSSVQHELAIGAESRKQATHWIVESPLRTGLLMLQKGVSHLGLSGQRPALIHLANAGLLLSALVMCWWSKSPLGYLIFTVSIISVAVTMLTWAHFGRYSIPVRPLWHLASAWTIVKGWEWMFGFRKAANLSTDARTQSL